MKGGDVPEALLLALKKCGKTVRKISAGPEARQRCWKVESTDGEVFFVKSREFFNNTELLMLRGKEEILYPLLWEERIGLEPTVICAEGFVFPYIQPFHDGELNPKILGRALKIFHGLPIEGFSLHLDEHLRFYLEDMEKEISASSLVEKKIWEKKVEGFREELQEFFSQQKSESFSFQKGFCHSDLMLNNLNWGNGGIRFIDCEYSGTTDIYWDFASIHAFFDPSDFQDFLESYAEKLENFVYCPEKLQYYISYREILTRLWWDWYSWKQLPQGARRANV